MVILCPYFLLEWKKLNNFGTKQLSNSSYSVPFLSETSPKNWILENISSKCCLWAEKDKKLCDFFDWLCWFFTPVYKKTEWFIPSVNLHVSPITFWKCGFPMKTTTNVPFIVSYQVKRWKGFVHACINVQVLNQCLIRVPVNKLIQYHHHFQNNNFSH